MLYTPLSAALDTSPHSTRSRPPPAPLCSAHHVPLPSSVTQHRVPYSITSPIRSRRPFRHVRPSRPASRRVPRDVIRSLLVSGIPASAFSRRPPAILLMMMIMLLLFLPLPLLPLNFPLPVACRVQAPVPHQAPRVGTQAPPRVNRTSALTRARAHRAHRPNTGVGRTHALHIRKGTQARTHALLRARARVHVCTRARPQRPIPERCNRDIGPYKIRL